jgi:hypothetical protein
MNVAAADAPAVAGAKQVLTATVTMVSWAPRPLTLYESRTPVCARVDLHRAEPPPPTLRI